MDYEIEDYDDDLANMYFEDDYITNDSFDHVFNNCFLQSLYGTSSLILKSIGINFIYFVLRWKYKRSNNLCHLLSTICGFGLIHTFFVIVELWPCILYMLLLYFVLMVFRHHFVIIGITILVLIYCEFCYPYPQTWLAARGLMMIFTMKIISLCKDLEGSKEITTFLQYVGYVFCPANLVMGPWIRYAQYHTQIEQACPVFNKVDYFVRIAKTLGKAIVFLTISNCWAHYFIPDDANTLLVMYRKALEFRCSHYFVCCTAEATMLAGGFNPETWFGAISRPLDIEAPRSLVTVVVAWNVPFHKFLHNYVYKSLLPNGVFIAILSTYAMSSLLHGLNLELSVVLLSLGLFSYVQIRFQGGLSRALQACVGVRPCAGPHRCKHKYTSRNWSVRAVVTLLSLSTVAQLAYLGILMDQVSHDGSFSDAAYAVYDKWSELYFFGHALVAVSWMYYGLFT